MKCRSWDVIVPGAMVEEEGVSFAAEELLVSESESLSEGLASSHSSKIARSSARVLKRRTPWPWSLMAGLRIHHSRVGAAKEAWSS